MNNKCTRGGVRHSIKNRLRRGFTITELVIVIAVIAILAAVLIPTFSNVVKNANRSHDEQLVHNMNTSLNAYAIENGGKGPADYEELMKWFAEDGFCDSSNPYLLGTSLKQDNVHLAWYPSSNSVFLIENSSRIMYSASLGLGNGISVTTLDDAGSQTTANAYALCSQGNSTEEFIAGLYYAFYDVCDGNIGTFLRDYASGPDAPYSRDKVLSSTDNEAWALAIVTAYNNQTEGYSYSTDMAEKLKNAAGDVSVGLTAPAADATEEEKLAAEQEVRTALATLSVLASDTVQNGSAAEMELKKVSLASEGASLEGFTVDMTDVTLSPIATTHRDLVNNDIENNQAGSEEKGLHPYGYSVDFCGLTLENLNVDQDDQFTAAGASYQDSKDNAYPGGAYNYSYGLFGTLYAPESGDGITISNLKIKGVHLNLNDAQNTNMNGQTYKTVSDSAGIICGTALGNVTFKNIEIDGTYVDENQQEQKGFISAYDAVGAIVGRCYGAGDGDNVGANVVKIENCSVSDLRVQGSRKVGGITGVYSAGSVIQVSNLTMQNVDVIGERNIEGDTAATDVYAGLFVGHINNVSNSAAQQVSFADITVTGCRCVNRYMSDSGWVYFLGGMAVDLGENAYPQNGTDYTIKNFCRNGSDNTKQVFPVDSSVKYSNYLRILGDINTNQIAMQNITIEGQTYNYSADEHIEFSYYFHNAVPYDGSAEYIPYLLKPEVSGG